LVITRKPLDLPPAVAKAFVKDMKAFFAEEDRYKQDEIAQDTRSVRQEKPLRLSCAKEMFMASRDQI
jgi:hypothetical protein